MFAKKRLVVTDGLTGEETPVSVTDRATVANLLQKLGYNPGTHALSRVSDRQVLSPKQRLDSSLNEGDRLFVFAKIEVGVTS